MYKFNAPDRSSPLVTKLMRWVLQSNTTAEARERLEISGAPGGTVPLGGVAGQLLASDGIPGGSLWVSGGLVPAGGSLGQMLVSDGTPYGSTWVVDESRVPKFANTLMLGGM